MTTSITLRIRFIELNKELIYFTKRTYLCQMIYSNILIIAINKGFAPTQNGFAW